MRSDVAVKVFGDDMQVLNDTAEKISKVLQGIDGASEVKVEQTTGLPVLTVDIDRDKAARFGLNVGDIQDTVATALGGRNAGTLFEATAASTSSSACRKPCAPTCRHCPTC